MGYTSDDVFAGNFVAAANGVADGFDKLAAYGKVGSSFRWLVDTNNDGVPEVSVLQGSATTNNGLPIAGNFDLSLPGGNGDEVGLFVSTTASANWLLDTDHDFVADYSIPTVMRGLAVVGDFDGDGHPDLATWHDDTFFVDLSSVGPTLNPKLPGLSGAVDREFRFGFIGVGERPVAADFDKDGFSDLGLWVPNRPGVTPGEGGEWYILVSGGKSLVVDTVTPAGVGVGNGRIVVDPIGGANVLTNNIIPFTPVPFGKDLYARFGDEQALPVVGNFDPPTTPLANTPNSLPLGRNPQDPFDVNADGIASPLDILATINELNQRGAHLIVDVATQTPMFWDVNGDGWVTSLDVLLGIAHLDGPGVPTNGAGGEGEAAPAFTSVNTTTASASFAVSATVNERLVKQLAADPGLGSQLTQQLRPTALETADVDPQLLLLEDLLERLAVDVADVWNPR